MLNIFFVSYEWGRVNGRMRREPLLPLSSHGLSICTAPPFQSSVRFHQQPPDRHISGLTNCHIPLPRQGSRFLLLSTFYYPRSHQASSSFVVVSLPFLSFPWSTFVVCSNKNEEKKKRKKTKRAHNPSSLHPPFPPLHPHRPFPSHPSP